MGLALLVVLETLAPAERLAFVLHDMFAVPFDQIAPIVVRADGAAVRMGAAGEVRGAAEVAGSFAGRAQAAQPALVNGAPGAVWVRGGQPRVAFGFTISGGKIVAIDIIADPERLQQLNLTVLDA